LVASRLAQERLDVLAQEQAPAASGPDRPEPALPLVQSDHLIADAEQLRGVPHGQKI
jgi:hypothetical protein